jgi:general secretion pathway protein G
VSYITLACLMAIALSPYLSATNAAGPASSRPAPAATAAGPQTDATKHDAAVNDIARLKIALALFFVQTGRHPSTSEGLGALIAAPDDVKKDWHGPYLEIMPNDPWGHPYIYRGPVSNSFELLSAGPDGKEGTTDDITRTTALLGPATKPALPDARRAAILQIHIFKTALDIFEVDILRYPTTAEGLDALIKATADPKDNWNGPYVSGGKVPADPWGQPYVYRGPDSAGKDKFDVLSAGPDGTLGTADDIDINTKK